MHRKAEGGLPTLSNAPQRSHEEAHDFIAGNVHLKHNERRTLLVIILTFAMMVIEVGYGYATSSMALLADGWHMATHAGALLISYAAYRFASSPRVNARFTFGGGKFLPLGGYTSAVILALIALLMVIESGERFFAPQAIRFDEAILVTGIGLLVNVVSAFILGRANHHHGHDHDHHHGHDHHHHHDPNLRSAYLHVLADALTSVMALFALVVGKLMGSTRLDAAMGVIASLVILRWSWQLCRDTAWELLDGHSRDISPDEVRRLVEEGDARVVDLHVWKIAPRANACEIVVLTRTLRGAEYYRARLLRHPVIKHVIVEEMKVA